QYSKHLQARAHRRLGFASGLVAIPCRIRVRFEHLEPNAGAIVARARHVVELLLETREELLSFGLRELRGRSRLELRPGHVIRRPEMVAGSDLAIDHPRDLFELLSTVRIRRNAR